MRGGGGGSFESYAYLTYIDITGLFSQSDEEKFTLLSSVTSSRYYEAFEFIKSLLPASYVVLQVLQSFCNVCLPAVR